MKPGAPDEERLTRYLLGQLGPDEQALIEEQYMGDPDLHDELRAVERDLIDQYVHGEGRFASRLSAEADAFEKHFLSSPARRQRVEFARALRQSLDRTPSVAETAVSDRTSAWPFRFPSRSPFWSLLGPAPGRPWQLAAAALVILAGGWLAIVSRQGSSERPPGAVSGPPAGRTQQEPPASRRPEAGQALGPETPSPLRVATFVLIPSLTRNSDETPTLTIEASVDVRLQLQIEAGDYGSYRVVLRTADGDEVWRQDRVKPERTASGAAIVVTLPASRFSSQDYTIRLSGITPAGEVEEVSGYSFRVKRG